MAVVFERIAIRPPARRPQAQAASAAKAPLRLQDTLILSIFA